MILLVIRTVVLAPLAGDLGHFADDGRQHDATILLALLIGDLLGHPQNLRHCKYLRFLENVFQFLADRKSLLFEYFSLGKKRNSSPK